MDHIQALIDKLEAESRLSREEWITLIEGRSPNLAEYLLKRRGSGSTGIMGTMYLPEG